jgi:site-specific DNA-methyltransferase (cytosine-N4-specific)
MEAAQIVSPRGLEALTQVDWSFLDEPAPHPVHGLHPYPAKFVAALPRRVIEALTEPGDLVLDPFAGSGTALVEALLLGRRAVGGDLNPVAVVSARAKTQCLGEGRLARLAGFREALDAESEALLEVAPLLPLPAAWEPVDGRRFRGLKFWFSEQVAKELTALKMVLAREEEPACRAVLEMCFSAIVVTVSWQDSDTRYVRRRKRLPPGSVTRLFERKLAETLAALEDLGRRIESSAAVVACDAREIDYVEPGSVRLAVTSPPYPNAYSYHLYHQNRILWLDEDPWDFKAREIGHHRAYSAAGGMGESDFRDDMTRSLAGIREALTPDGHAVVVVGDSIVRGELVPNDRVVVEAAGDAGLELAAVFNRVIDPKRKSFNPAIGKIKTEHVLVFAP